MSSSDAKTYLSRRNIPSLFECLMSGLMFHRPSDHLQYLIDCLEKIKIKGQDEMRWNMFIEMQRSKTPLPPITPSNGRRPISRERSKTPKDNTKELKDEEEERQSEGKDRTPTPLPPIKDRGVPDVPIVFLVGGPGSGKSTQAQLLLQKYSGWVTVPVGELLRQGVAEKGEADAKWKMVSELMSRGEMAPEDVVDTLLVDKLRESHNADGFIIQGFPRDMEQAAEYEKEIGRVDAVFLLDCEEETLSRQLLERARDSKRIDNNPNTVAKRIQAFKEKTLPVLKYYDDLDKLYILEGEKEVNDIAEDLAIVFETVVGSKGRLSPAALRSPAPPKTKRTSSSRGGRMTPKRSGSRQSPSPPSPPAQPEPEQEVPDLLPAYLMPPEVTVKDEGRKPDMPQAPIIFVAGGPGSGKGTQCKRLLSRYTNAVHLSMGDILRNKISTEGTADAKWGMVSELLQQGDLAPEDVTVDLVTKALKDKPDAHFFLVEGFPRNLQQLEDFNGQIGGHNFTILLDCEEAILHWRLTVRGKQSDRIDDNLVAIGKKLTFFKNNTLPILKTLDDSGKLVVVSGDRDEDEIHYDLCKILDFAIYGNLPEIPAGAQSKEPPAKEEKEGEVEEVVEEVVVAATTVTTGDDVANPAHSTSLHGLPDNATAGETKSTVEDTDDTTAMDGEKTKAAYRESADGLAPAPTTTTDTTTTQSVAAVADDDTPAESATDQRHAEHVPKADPTPVLEIPSTGQDEAAEESPNDMGTEIPSVTEKLPETESYSVDENGQKEQSVKGEEQSKVEEPPQPGEPLKAAEPSRPGEPLKADEPSRPGESLKADEPLKTEEPLKAEEPSRPGEPLKAEEPLKTEEPLKAEEAFNADGPLKAEEAVKADGPLDAEGLPIAEVSLNAEETAANEEPSTRRELPKSEEITEIKQAAEETREVSSNEEPAKVAKEEDPKATDTIGAEEDTKAPETSDVVEDPKAAEATEAVEDPKAAEATEAVEDPKAAEATDAVEDPKAAEATDAVEDPKAAEATDAVEDPKAAEATDAVEDPKAAEATDAVEGSKGEDTEDAVEDRKTSRDGPMTSPERTVEDCHKEPSGISGEEAATGENPASTAPPPTTAYDGEETSRTDTAVTMEEKDKEKEEKEEKEETPAGEQAVTE